MTIEHVHCGGELSEYNPTEKELIVLNKLRKRERLPEIIFYVDRIHHTLTLKENNFFQCGKCGQKLRVIPCPSYNDYIEMEYEKYLSGISREIYYKPKVFFFSIQSNKRCLACGRANDAGVRKCIYCGKKFNRKIPEPRIITDTGQRFGL